MQTKIVATNAKPITHKEMLLRIITAEYNKYVNCIHPCF